MRVELLMKVLSSNRGDYKQTDEAKAAKHRKQAQHGSTKSASTIGTRMEKLFPGINAPTKKKRKGCKLGEQDRDLEAQGYQWPQQEALGTAWGTDRWSKSTVPRKSKETDNDPHKAKRSCSMCQDASFNPP